MEAGIQEPYFHILVCLLGWFVFFEDSPLTTRYDHPDKVHEEIIKPKVVCLRSAVGYVLVVMVEHAGGKVEHQAIHLSNRHQGLQRISKWVLDNNEPGYDVGERTPEYLGICVSIPLDIQLLYE